MKGRGGLTHRIAVEQENTQRGPGGVLQAQEEGLNTVEVLHVLGGKNNHDNHLLVIMNLHMEVMNYSFTHKDNNCGNY